MEETNVVKGAYRGNDKKAVINEAKRNEETRSERDSRKQQRYTKGSGAKRMSKNAAKKQHDGRSGRQRTE